MNMPVVQASPHTHEARRVSQIMFLVICALIPATGFGIYEFGWPALNLLVLSIISALVCEAFSLWVAKKPVTPYLFDGSAILTAWLLAMSLPPWAPWWIAVLGNAFAIIIGKQLFGGIGQNVFNPAMLARVVLLVSFPLEMTTWIAPHPLFSAAAPDFMQGLSITFLGIPNLDSVSSASVLGHIKTGFTQGHDVAQSLANFSYTPLALALGTVPGSMGEASAVLVVLGGLLLLALRIITWHIPVSMIATVAVLSTLGHTLDPDHYLSPVYHMLGGGLMLGAFFIATDMVTSPSTPKGQVIFGVGCGVLDYVIRTWGGFPEGIGFAVMLMNAATPLIDHYVRPRIYGRGKDGNPLSVEKAPVDQISIDKVSIEKPAQDVTT